MNTAILLWGILFSSIGLGLFIYGKKQRKVVPLICGIAVIAYPYFISNTLVLVAIGIALVWIPYSVRI